MKGWTQKDIDRLNGVTTTSLVKATKPRNQKPVVDASAILLRQKALYVIGIDPGVTTGFAIWHRRTEQFAFIKSASILQVQHELLLLEHREQYFVRFEDARLRTWFGKMDAEQAKYGAAVREGSGSIKRDCTIWEEFLTRGNWNYEKVAPKQNKTKLDSERFVQYTGWQLPTNEHGRDAAMLCFKL